MIAYPPANTFGDPSATLVQVGSPTRPTCLELTNTVDDPADMGVECAGQGDPGNK